MKAKISWPVPLNPGVVAISELKCSLTGLYSEHFFLLSFKLLISGSKIIHLRFSFFDLLNFNLIVVEYDVTRCDITIIVLIDATIQYKVTCQLHHSRVATIQFQPCMVKSTSAKWDMSMSIKLKIFQQLIFVSGVIIF